MKFLIRDDDPCAFTRPEELETCYQRIWDHVPVNLSVTPFRIPGPDKTLPDEVRGLERVMPLEENAELVSLLKEGVQSSRLQIALHGYHHARRNGLPEYVAGQDLETKTRKGKAYLQQLLECDVSTFVPPNNGISRQGLSAIIANGLNLIGMPSLLRSQFRPFAVGNVWRHLQVKYYENYHRVRFPYVLDVDGHKEVNYFAVTPSQSLSYLLDGFERVLRLNGVFIFAVHYHAFNRRLQSGERISDVLNLFLDKVAANDQAVCCGYDELWGMA